jgi:hypothetical protein
MVQVIGRHGFSLLRNFVAALTSGAHATTFQKMLRRLKFIVKLRDANSHDKNVAAHLARRYS